MDNQLSKGQALPLHSLMAPLSTNTDSDRLFDEIKMPVVRRIVPLVRTSSQRSDVTTPLGFTSREFADLAGIPRATVDSWMATGEITSEMHRGSVRIPFSEYERYARCMVNKKLAALRAERIGLFAFPTDSRV